MARITWLINQIVLSLGAVVPMSLYTGGISLACRFPFHIYTTKHHMLTVLKSQVIGIPRLAEMLKGRLCSAMNKLTIIVEYLT